MQAQEQAPPEKGLAQNEIGAVRSVWNAVFCITCASWVPKQPFEAHAKIVVGSSHQLCRMANTLARYNSETLHAIFFHEQSPLRGTASPGSQYTVSTHFSTTVAARECCSSVDFGRGFCGAQSSWWYKLPLAACTLRWTASVACPTLCMHFPYECDSSCWEHRLDALVLRRVKNAKHSNCSMFQHLVSPV